MQMRRLANFPYIVVRLRCDVCKRAGAYRLAEPRPSAKRGSPRARETADAERRQVSVMFCDLVASTALSTQLDVEDYRDLIRAYQGACAGVVARFDGFLAKLIRGFARLDPRCIRLHDLPAVQPGLAAKLRRAAVSRRTPTG